MKYTVTVGGREFQVELTGGDVYLDGERVEADLTRIPGGPLYHLSYAMHGSLIGMQRVSEGWSVVSRGEILEAEVVDERTRQLRQMTGAGVGESGRHVVKAPMPGLVLRVEVEAGTAVAKGQGLLVLEAMKMENELKAPGAGTVSAIHVEPGQAVEKGPPLVEVSHEP